MDGDRRCTANLRRYFGRCDRPGTVEVGGKWYCWQHDPHRLRAEAADRWEKRKAELAREEAEQDARIARRKLLRDAGLLEVSDAVALHVLIAGGLDALVARDRFASEVAVAAFHPEAFEAEVLSGLNLDRAGAVLLNLAPYAPAPQVAAWKGRRVIVAPVPAPPAPATAPAPAPQEEPARDG